MFVCSCNALTDREIEEVCREAAGSPSRVYRCLGYKPQCGICLKTIQKIFVSVQSQAMTSVEVEAALFEETTVACACDGNCEACAQRHQATADAPAPAPITADA